MTADRQTTPPAERYTMGYGDGARAMMSQRTIDNMADFLLPHLRPGMRLLDVGCGPGSITVGLAAAVRPGEVVGLDIEPTQLEQARMRATEAGLTNIRFVPGNAYDLPFPDASFDVVFAANVLQHLGEPLRALREFRRVLGPGGLAGIMDPDWTMRVITPVTPLLEREHEIRVRLWEANGGSPGYARHLRGLLLDAGFARAETYPIAAARGTPEQMQLLSHVPNEFRSFRESIIAHGLADGPTVEAIATEFEAWMQRPDATFVAVRFRALGWVDVSSWRGGA